MSHLVQVQASYIGVGKSTFINQLNFPQIDDGIDLVSCFEDWYNEPFLNDVLKAMVMLENSVIKTNLIRNSIIFASRSPLISAFQFLRQGNEEIANNFIYYYKKRLQKNVKSVTILDYGDCIVKNEHLIQLAYQRMRKRNRKFETDFFVNDNVYKQFFEDCEQKKRIIVDKIKQDSFFNYVSIENFHGFYYIDLIKLIKIAFK